MKRSGNGSQAHFLFEIKGAPEFEVAYFQATGRISEPDVIPAALAGKSEIPFDHIIQKEALLTLSATGEFVDLRPVTPKEFGQSHKPDEFIGACAMPAGMTSEQVLQSTDHPYRLDDLFLPGVYARPSSAGQEIGEAAKEFKELFRLLSEAPLQPYYRFSGKDFFNWIDRGSRTG